MCERNAARHAKIAAKITPLESLNKEDVGGGGGGGGGCEEAIWKYNAFLQPFFDYSEKLRVQNKK